MHAGITRLAIGCAALVLLCACDRTTGGTASDAGISTTATAAQSATTETSSTAGTETARPSVSPTARLPTPPRPGAPRRAHRS